MFVCIPKRAAHRAAAGILCAALAVCGAALALRAHAQGQEAVAAASYEWGLSFQEENQPPVPNLTAEQLRPYDAYYCGDTGQKRLDVYKRQVLPSGILTVKRLWRRSACPLWRVPNPAPWCRTPTSPWTKLPCLWNRCV